MSHNDSKIAFKRSTEWALARSVERGMVLKRSLVISRLRRVKAYADPPPVVSFEACL